MAYNLKLFWQTRHNLMSYCGNCGTWQHKGLNCPECGLLMRRGPRKLKSKIEVSRY